MQWRPAGHWLVQAARNQALRQGLADVSDDDDDFLNQDAPDDTVAPRARRCSIQDPDSDDDADGSHLHARRVAPTWALAYQTSCSACSSDPLAGSIRASAAPALADRDARPCHSLSVFPVTARHTPTGTIVGRLTGDQPQGLWAVAHRRWWPPPRSVAAAAATAEWRHRRCPTCGDYVVDLIASVTLQEGAELTVDASPHILGNTDLVPWEVTFDGGARALQGRRVAGAGALLWGPPTVAARGESRPAPWWHSQVSNTHRSQRRGACGSDCSFSAASNPRIGVGAS